MKQLSLSEAVRLSRKKWEEIVETGTYASHDPELKKLMGHCGFCERYAKRMKGRKNRDCSSCELNFRFEDGCTNAKHPFMLSPMLGEKLKNSPYAIQILDKIKSIKV